jgi:hypothetical protein
VGALELYFDKTKGYAEQDIHTCQLMAGLVTEAMGREAGLTLKKSMAEERSTMLAAIERLQPNLAALAENSAANAHENKPAVGATRPEVICAKCNSQFMPEEQFCGTCGAPRPQGKTEAASQSPAGRSLALGGVISGPDGFTQEEADELAESLALAAEIDSGSSEIQPAQRTLEHDAVWRSAARAQEFLQSLSPRRTPGALVRFWQSRRGDFYLGVAIALVIFVIGWGIWSNHSLGAGRASAASTNANQARKPAPDPDLSMFDKLLITLGLAEAPAVPEYKYKGNPDVQVWVDLNTAQYYCPGSELYQKTPKGKLSTQREAQLDQFEPASRKACD